MKTFLATAALSLAIYGCQSGPDVNALQNQISSLQQQNAHLQQELAAVQQQSDSCAAKFSRSTFLYDVGLFGPPQRVWIIPADVEPMTVGITKGTYSHYDPKTQTETVQFKGKPAQ